MENDMQRSRNKKLLLTIVGVAILVVLTVGVTYAFFNYTRTGGTNVVKTGRISFNAIEGTTINLTNAFPITSEQAANDTTNAKTLSITVTGDTDYAGGLEYLVTAADVHMTTVGNKVVPLTIEVGVQDIGTVPNATSLGTSDSSYYTNRSTYAASHYNRYKIEYDGSLDEGDRLLVGYIAPNTTVGTAEGVNGVINIKAYFDAGRIAITDTLETDGEGNGTTTSWVGDRTRFTTTEWNALVSSGLSFRVRIESNEGIWVANPGSATMTLAQNSGNVTEGESDTVAITNNGNGVMGCTSSAPSVATCSVTSNTLTINGVSEGSATLTITQAAGTEYATPTSITYTVTVESATFKGTATQLAAKASTYGLETNEAGNKIYTGANPDNYVKFNCNNNECETWRIIGVYEGKLKIVKASPLAETKEYDDSSIVWEGSDLELWLNNETTGYYSTLSQTAKEMIVAGTWNAGAASRDANASQAYASATGSPASIISRKVGLIASYEYLYAASNDGCWSTSGYDYDGGCGRQDWLTQSSYLWTLSPRSGYDRSALCVVSGGFVGGSDVSYTNGVSPAVYLNQAVTITGGKGQSGGNEYTLSYTAS